MASLRDKIAANAQPYLAPGEQVQGVFGAQTSSQYWIFLAVIVFLVLNDYRTVVATDRRILVFDSGKLFATKTKSVLAELPRQTVLGPPKGLWFTTTLGPETVRVHKRFHKDIVAIDTAGARPPR